jgi:hypothetical protein
LLGPDDALNASSGSQLVSEGTELQIDTFGPRDR